MKKSIFVLPLIAISMFASCSKNNLDAWFKQSIVHAMETKEENIRTLVTISNSDPKTIWKDDKVLMTTFHNYPESYIEGETITLGWESWVTSAKEFSVVYKEKKDSFKNDPALRVKQLLGLHYESKNQYMTSYWVDPDDLIRPAYVTNITKQMKLTFDEDVTQDYKDWFQNQYKSCYFGDNQLPWTRLGYTYDWAGNDRYGLSEFVIMKDREASVTIEKTAPVNEFLDYLEDL